MTKSIKGVKLRLYPNKQHQQAQLWQMLGNDRQSVESHARYG
ncbi:helix-turn-helix domain-containing protein [Limosilactobacillus fermentum]